MTTDAPVRLLTTAEVAERFGVNVVTVYRWTWKGQLRPVQMGAKGRLRFRESDIAAILNRGDHYHGNGGPPSD